MVHESEVAGGISTDEYSSKQPIEYNAETTGGDVVPVRRAVAIRLHCAPFTDRNDSCEPCPERFPG